MSSKEEDQITGVGHYGSFIVALPDIDSGFLVQERLRDSTNVRLDHPSGRPWLLARVATESLLAHTEGQRRVAMVGPTSASPDDLGRIARQVRTPRELADSSRRFDGSFCVFGSFEGLLYASGPARKHAGYSTQRSTVSVSWQTVRTYSLNSAV